MSITYPLNLPSLSGIREITWHKETAQSQSVSPFSLKTKRYDWGGDRWRAEVEIPPMHQEYGRVWEAWFLSLNGVIGTFWLEPTVDKVATGIATGTPLVNGGNQSGKSIITDGWTVGQTGILKAGDWIQIGNHLYRILQAANSDGSGNATFDIWPNLRTSPSDNDAIIVTNPKGKFRLGAMPPLKWTSDQLTQGFKFTAIEDI